MNDANDVRNGAFAAVNWVARPPQPRLAHPYDNRDRISASFAGYAGMEAWVQPRLGFRLPLGREYSSPTD